LTNWRIRGEADYDFVAGTSIAAGEAIIVVPFDPAIDVNTLAAFSAHYGIASGVTVVGGASLSNSTGRVSLQQPDSPDALGDIPHVVVDEVIYDDLAPWAAADGSGQALTREVLTSNGNLAASWIAATPSPGVDTSVADFIPGDVDQNGIVDFQDISPFISLLSQSGYLEEADMNQDGVVDFFDISPFIDALAAR